jgi:hypothetical protein
LHPAKHAKFVERLVREDKENEDLNLQKNFKFFLRETKEVVLLHPLRETRKVIIEAKKIRRTRS